MKVAVLISGYLRSYKQNLPKFINHLKNKFSNIDVYMHITSDNNSDKYFNPSNIFQDLNFILDEINVKSILIEKNNVFHDTDVLKNIWFKYFKLNHLKIINENNFGKYDLVFKYRPDMEINFENSLINFDNLNYLNIPDDSKIDKDKLKNITDKFICDIFAFGNTEVMNKYFDIYNDLENLCNKFGNVPETVLFHYLDKNNIKYKLTKIDYKMILSKCNVFALTGDSGSGKSTLAKYLRKFFDNSFILECDRYHKWERSSENWKSYTHLNPQANYISKMKQDIFNLSIGNSIYQIDYDHNTGKFTDKKLIESTDNLIVCGLHSLVDKNSNNIYDLKIYLDTDEKLKTKWKISRDTSERNQKSEEVLNKIASRKKDYCEYIEPQKNEADVIINFYENKLDELALRIYVRKIFSIDNIIQALEVKNINYNSTENDLFYVLDFQEYHHKNLWDYSVPFFNNHYDTIIFTILNINKNLSIVN